MAQQTLSVVDSHTGGEPTRIIVAGGPDLDGPLSNRVQQLRNTADYIRTSVILEPRGSDVLVGGLLTPPAASDCAAGIIFFNNVDYLHMCGHGTIGLAVTLAHMGTLQTGSHQFDTPVGVVSATLHDANRVTIRNVPSWRYRAGVSVEIPGHGPVTGDVAWGGNWFFLVSDHGQSLTLDNTDVLTRFTEAIRDALKRQGITGADNGLIDHIELFDISDSADSRNFVLCPGGAYDRSPCGTGTSAKLACLAADGKLQAGETWVQESIVGSAFEGSFEAVEASADLPTGAGPVIVPSITGSAWITAESTLFLDESDPFRTGIQA